MKIEFQKQKTFEMFGNERWVYTFICPQCQFNGVESLVDPNLLRDDWLLCTTCECKNERRTNDYSI
jgi:hypothetical protein